VTGGGSFCIGIF